jgi:hypothetical protein
MVNSLLSSLSLLLSSLVFTCLHFPFCPSFLPFLTLFLLHKGCLGAFLPFLSHQRLEKGSYLASREDDLAISGFPTIIQEVMLSIFVIESDSRPSFSEVVPILRKHGTALQ